MSDASPSLSADRPIVDPAAADAALAFVDSVVRHGWVMHPDHDKQQHPESPAWMRHHFEPLCAWVRAMNPSCMNFAELDRMAWLFRTSDLKRYMEDPQTESTVLLVASFGWVIRLWQAESLCADKRWQPRAPYYGLPLHLLETIASAAQGLQAGTHPKIHPDAVWATRPQRVLLSEAEGPAAEVLWASEEIRRNIEGEQTPSLQADFDLFRLYDRLNWEFSQVPTEGYQPCFTTVFEDAGISGTCAHTAVHSLRHGVHLRLIEAAFSARGFPSGWRPQSWDLVYWTPEARRLAAGKLPQLNSGKWRAQLQIENTRLRPKRTAGKPKGIPKTEAEVLVRRWLLKHAKDAPAAVTRDTVAAETGVSAGAVSNTAAWIAFRERRNAEAKAGERKIPLTDEMIAAIPADCDTPAELAELIEEQEAERADEERRHKRRHKPS